MDSVQRPREWGDAVGSDQYEEDPCAICHEELSSAPVATLDCRHQFHDQVCFVFFKILLLFILYINFLYINCSYWSVSLLE